MAWTHSVMQAAPDSIETEYVLKCAVCGVECRKMVRHCRDYLCGLPGEWNFSQCPVCWSLWLNPSPVESAIPSLYPGNYCFTRVCDTMTSKFPSGVSGSAKLSILDRFYGYDSVEKKADQQIGVLLARILGVFLLRKAGHSVRFLKKPAAGRLLDVGCGNGDFLLWMQRLGWEVEGIELDPVAAKIAIERRLRVTVGNIKTIDLPVAHFDAVTLSHVAEHFASPAAVLQRLSPCLKQNGVLVSISPNPSGVLRRFFGSKWYALDPPRHLFIPSAAAYRRALEPLGFQVKTWTSMRLFHWVFKESASIATSGKVATISDSLPLRFLTAALSMLFSCWPGLGEEVICYARKR